MSAIGFFKDVLIDNRRNALWNIERILGIADPRKSVLWEESDEHYKGLNVKNERVLVLGSDYGVTPMYFLSKGAKSVVGYSLWKQYFFHSDYEHRQEPFTMDKIKGERFDVMTADCEGCEYLLTNDFLENLKSYVICFHAPVENEQILQYVKGIGISIPPPEPVPQSKQEIAIYEVVR